MPGDLARSRIPFRSVNRKDESGYLPEMQRHHLLPLQVLSERPLCRMVEAVGLRGAALDDFRSNGLLLPATEARALDVGMPLHRGPHRDYNAVVIARVGQIERAWSCLRLKRPRRAIEQVRMQLGLLQRTLRMRLLAPKGEPFVLNRRDPLDRDVDFSSLDAMADLIWGDVAE